MIEWLFVCRIILQPWQKYLVILNPAGMGAVRNTHAALHNAGKPFFYDDSLINISLSAWKYSEQPGISCCPVFQLSSPLLCWRNKDLASRPKTELKAKWKESLTGTLKASSHCWTAKNGFIYFYIYWLLVYDTYFWFKVYIREGCGKSKWKFKMAFAMKGGGVSRGSRLPLSYFEKWFF